MRWKSHVQCEQVDAREEVDKNVNDKIEALRKSGILSEEEVAATAETLRKSEIHKKKGQLDEILISKRPEALRKKSREFLYNNANEAANAILEENGIDPKENTLYDKFNKLIFGLNALFKKSLQAIKKQLVFILVLIY
jgi:dGTP triphosphohydrolase